MKYSFFILFIIISSFIYSCAPSLVFSPSLNQPSKPLEKHQTRVTGGFEMLQETIPQKAERFISPGLSGSIAYGFTNSLSLQAKGWIALQNVEQYTNRFGFSLSGMIYLNDSTNILRYALIPCFGMTFDNKNWGTGKGTGIWLSAWLNNKSNFKPYCAIGTLLGWEDFNEPIQDWGWGLFLNPGVTLESNKYIEWNIELSNSIVFNRYENSIYFIIAPSVAIGIKF